MDCPRCGGSLDAYTLQENRALRCADCGWTGTEADLADVEGVGPSESWEEALEGVSGRPGTVDRRGADLPPVATGETTDEGGEPTPHVERIPDAGDSEESDSDGPTGDDDADGE